MQITKTIFLVSTLAIIFTGCNTMSGVGKDVKQGGKAIENAAERHKQAKWYVSNVGWIHKQNSILMQNIKFKNARQHEKK